MSLLTPSAFLSLPSHNLSIYAIKQETCVQYSGFSVQVRTAPNLGRLLRTRNLSTVFIVTICNTRIQGRDHHA